METLAGNRLPDMTLPYAQMIKYSFGCDPEFFAVDSSGDYISVIGKLGGTKEEPLPVRGGGIQEDNVAAEINTDPAITFEQFDSNIRMVMGELEKRLHKLGLSVAAVPHAYFKPDQLVSDKAKTFGCVPDYNVWTGEQNPAPTGVSTNLRTAAGHIHYGYALHPALRSRGMLDFIKRKTVVLSDLLIGIPSVVLDPDVTRRTLYGKAGAYRYKMLPTIPRQTAVVEYRTPSNFWVRDPLLRKWMYNQMMAVSRWLGNANHLKEFYPDPELVQHIINTGDVDGAKKMIKKYRIVMPEDVE